MSGFRTDSSSIQPASGSRPVRLFVGLMTVAMLAGALFLTRSEAAAQSANAPRAGSAPAGNAQHGREVYDRIGCWECHGRDGQSGNPKLGPNPLPFAAFTQQLRTPRNSMPPYTAKVLLDADIADIYAFVQTLPQPPKLDSIPLLKP